MQPAIKMALRIARQSSEYLVNQHQRLAPATQDAENVLRTLKTLERSIHENCVEQLGRSYRDHYFAPPGDTDPNNHVLSWHIFPVLGAQNFSRGLPDFATALLQKKDNRPENLILIQPMTGEEYSASRGYGAALNSRRIRAASASHLDEALLSTNLSGLITEPEDELLGASMAQSLAAKGASLRYSGCNVLDIARVAAGHLDGAALAPVQSADRVIGTFLMQEAGGLTGDLQGNPVTDRTRGLIVGNARIFRETLQSLQAFRQRITNTRF